MRALLDEVARQLMASRWLDDDVRQDAAREARLLVSAVMGIGPGDLARMINHTVDQPDAGRALDRLTTRLTEQVRAATNRRARGEPLAYAVGTAAFRHLVLQVDARVLIPRPETEDVVEEALRVTGSVAGGLAVDIGTGSGAIALALATEGRFERVVATDISADALEVARVNLEAVSPPIPVELRLGADLAPLEGLRARVIVSNPPYIAYEEAAALPASVRDWEPSTALFAADRGMARYKVLLAGASRFLEPGGFVVCEVDARRADETAAMAVAQGWVDVRLTRDLSGRQRVLVARCVSGPPPD